MTDPSRRAFLAGAAALVIAGCADGNEPAPDEAFDTNESSPTSTTSTNRQTSDLDPLTPAMFEALAVCTLAPSSTAGPFPSRELLDRYDITDGVPGHPLRLGVRVVDAECRPVPGAAVELWHTDATGDYSDYVDRGDGKDEGPGTTFCRGIQTANGDGIAEFHTIYPGWYRGRAVHIHTRVHLDDDVALTAQLYFDEDYTEAVLATGAYAEFGPPDTTWADDGIVGDPAADGTGIVLQAAATARGEGSLGLVNLGVDT